MLSPSLREAGPGGPGGPSGPGGPGAGTKDHGSEIVFLYLNLYLYLYLYLCVISKFLMYKNT